MSSLDKKALSERDICSKFIAPALEAAGWDRLLQIREEVNLTRGRVQVRGRLVSRAAPRRADYVLYLRDQRPIAVIEAKDNNHGVSGGMQQALAYAEMLDVPFAYSSNGDAFVEHDRTVTSGPRERELPLGAFPSPAELLARYQRWKGLDATQQAVVDQDYYADASGKAPRYYQQIAINRTVEAIARGQRRVLLVMATGTGKTYTAFQIMWRLLKSGKAKRILFLADRNVLVDQAKLKDFAPFGSNMTKISGRKIDTAFEVYLALYQAVSGADEARNVYKQFSPGFFDLVVVDECHRGSAAEDSAWREILDHFSSAAQIGMTATPKETREVSNIEYFGEPIYTYSLRQGIDDGFLAPYKVIRVDLDKDLVGYRVAEGQRDKYGREIPAGTYGGKDFDRTLVLERRTELVARRVTELLKATDRYGKTIVFCEDIEHAERMRKALVNENADLVAKDSRYVVQITGDNAEGKAELDNFIMPRSTYPVVVTTSKLLTTGVDVETCKLIVLDQNIQSPTEFKQIIGRGTRLYEDGDQRKDYFTILDFRRATLLFADPNFDGEPEQVYEPGDGEPVAPPEPDDEEDGDDEGAGELDRHRKRQKFYVANADVNIVAEREQVYGKDGKLLTESFRDLARRALQRQFLSLDEFLRRWSKADQKRAIVDELRAQGGLFEALEEDVGREYDPFDLICYLAFDQPPQSRRQRAERARRSDVFSRHGDKARAVLGALLEKYADQGLENIEDLAVLKVQPLTQLGTPRELVDAFGGKQRFLEALRELREAIYQQAG